MDDNPNLKILKRYGKNHIGYEITEGYNDDKISVMLERAYIGGKYEEDCDFQRVYLSFEWIEKIYNEMKEIKDQENNMKLWEHCAKKWFRIPFDLALENLKMKSIIKCEFNGEEIAIFNISDNYYDVKTFTSLISNEHIIYGDWFVYTWAD